MVRVLITGMSGTGKSTVLRALAGRGHRVVDTDEDGWSLEVASAEGVEHVWREDRIAALLRQEIDGWLFVGGCVSNQGRFAGSFDAVVLLSAPVELMLTRVRHRTDNPFGSRPQCRESGPSNTT